MTHENLCQPAIQSPHDRPHTAAVPRSSKKNMILTINSGDFLPFVHCSCNIATNSEWVIEKQAIKNLCWLCTIVLLPVFQFFFANWRNNLIVLPFRRFFFLFGFVLVRNNKLFFTVVWKFRESYECVEWSNFCLSVCLLVLEVFFLKFY